MIDYRMQKKDPATGEQMPGSITLTAESSYIAQEYKLSLGQRMIYGIIYTYCTRGKKKDCTLPFAYFEQWTGISHAGVIKIIKQLQLKNLINIEPFLAENSNVARNRYTLNVSKYQSPAARKADVRAQAEMRLQELKKRKADALIRKQGLEPLPPDLEGQGWKAIRTDENGQRWLVPDGSDRSKNYETRYYSKEQFNGLFNKCPKIEDVEI